MSLTNPLCPDHNGIMKSKNHPSRQGFTLMELLVVLGVMGLVMGMLLPAVGVVRDKAERMVTGNKLRQLGLAVASYGDLTGQALGATSLEDWMTRLAQETGLCTGETFLFPEDPRMAALGKPIPPVLVRKGPAGTGWQAIDDFASWPIGLAVTSGIPRSAPPSTTPVAWTRGLLRNGEWQGGEGVRQGVYGDTGGFIVFLDGHVQFYRNLHDAGGQLIRYADGERTHDVKEALPSGVTVFDCEGALW
jgi:prepilin-type N-terminal cleavage/methylation domain-containing protein